MLTAKMILIAALVIGLFAAGFFFLSQPSTTGTKEVQAPGGLTAGPGTFTEVATQSASPGTLNLFSKLNVTADNDPVMGNWDAKITIIEFSDFECPRCKKFFDASLPQLKKEYIDKGIVKLVYRDFLVPYFENSPKEAQAAECARDQGGDGTYFQYHDEIFKRTRSNGTGLPLSELPVIARDIGIDVSKWSQCLAEEKFKGEVEKDTSDGRALQIVGTPTFFIGRVNQSGEFEGMKLSGAYPFKTFQLILDYQLQQLQQ